MTRPDANWNPFDLIPFRRRHAELCIITAQGKSKPAMNITDPAQAEIFLILALRRIVIIPGLFISILPARIPAARLSPAGFISPSRKTGLTRFNIPSPAGIASGSRRPISMTPVLTPRIAI